MNTSSIEIHSQPSLTDFWQVLKRRRWVAISFFLICSLTVTLATFLMTPLYVGETTILIEAENSKMLNVDEASSDISNYNIFEDYIETQIALIKSDRIAGRVYEEFKLKETPRYQKKEGLAKIFKKRFTDDIELIRRRNTRMIDIAVYNPDPKIAADLANRLSETYVQDNLTTRALTFIRNQRMASLNAEFLRLQSKYDSLSNIYGPKHPEMISLKEEIRLMAKRIDSEKYKGEAETAPQTSEEQALLENTLLKIQESSVLSSSRMNNVGIVDRAIVKKDVAMPKRPLNISLGIILGLIGGVLLAFLVDYLDDTVKNEDDLKRFIAKVVFLGSLLSERATKTFDKIRNCRIVSEKPDTASTEAYRLLRTRVLWSISKENPLKDLAVLSSMPGEGKTTVSCNFAISMAQLNSKTLLVDTDIRQGRIHDVFDLSNENGIGHYLSGHATFDKAVQKTDIPGLSVVTCGKSVIDSSQLFSSHKMEEFIKEARKHFEMIIYDTPPVTVISDAIIIQQKLGGGILVARSGLTSRRVLQKALSIINESNSQLIGVVLNDSSSGDTLTYNKYYDAYRKK